MREFGFFCICKEFGFLPELTGQSGYPNFFVLDFAVLNSRLYITIQLFCFLRKGFMKDLDIIIKALADVNRIRILKLIEKRRMCVCELAFVLGISQPAVSKQLKKMVKAGLIDCEPDGFWTNYFIKPKTLYAKKFLSLLCQWLNNEKTVLDDLRKADKADRRKLCCRK